MQNSFLNAEKELNSSFESNTPIKFTDIPWEKKVFQGDLSKAGTMARVTGHSKVISYSDRPMVLLDIDGFKQPFYRSTGAGGKKDVAAGKWYPFFGVGDDGWLNKLSGKQINTGYGSEHLLKISEILNNHFPASMDFKQHAVGRTGVHIDALNTSLKGTANGTASTVSIINGNIDTSRTTLAKKLGKVSPKSTITPTPNPVPPVVPVPPIPAAAPPPVQKPQQVLNKSNIFSFDTETTGVNPKTSNIWQTGMASGDNRVQIQEHLNPFDTAPKTGREFFNKLRGSNGLFSENAAAKGNFNTAVSAFNTGALTTLDSAVDKMFGRLDEKSILVMQNAEFENKYLKQGYKDGKISEQTWQMMQGKMDNVAASMESGEKLDILQKPLAVQAHMRKAEMEFHMGYLRNGDDKTFDRYVGHLNSAMSAYEEEAFNPLRKGAMTVELMDVSKAFYGNAALKGLIDKRTAMLGTNLNFLSEVLGFGEEHHTALSDSQRTLQVFDKLHPMIKELQSGQPLSAETTQVLERVKAAQGAEVNRRFQSSVKSVISDFDQFGGTRINDGDNWYQPRVTVHNKSTGSIESLSEVQIGRGKNRITDFDTAMDTVLNKWSTYRDEINGYSRQDVLDRVKEARNNGTDFKELQRHVDLNTLPPSSTATTDLFHSPANTKSTAKDVSFFKQDTTLFGRQMTKGTKYGIIGGLLGLGYMATRSEPPPLPRQQTQSDPVYENFYSPQYLGTAFVDFNNRNKHYSY